MPLCILCEEEKEQLLILPCSDQHKGCRSCLGKQSLLGYTIKCHECRKVFGKVDLDLLKIEGGELPDKQKCKPCLDHDKRSEPAVLFCQTCSKTLCERCKEIDRKFFRDKLAHEILPFEEYRKSSDKLSAWLCDNVNHAHVVKATCSACRHMGCLECQVEPSVCTAQEGGGTHAYMALKVTEELTKVTLKERRDHVIASKMKISDDKKIKLDEMEKYRKTTEKRRAKLKQRYEEQIQKLNKEYETLEGELNSALKCKAEEMEVQRNLYNEEDILFQNTEDGLTGILSSYHAARLVGDEQDILEDVAKVVDKTTPINFTPLSLNKVDIDATNLLGLTVTAKQVNLEEVNREQTPAVNQNGASSSAAPNKIEPVSAPWSSWSCVPDESPPVVTRKSWIERPTEMGSGRPQSCVARKEKLKKPRQA